MSYSWKVWKRRFVRQPLRALRRRWRSIRGSRSREQARLHKRVRTLEQNQRNLIQSLHADLAGDADQRDVLRRAELRVYSQNGEDGLLLYLFSRLGASDRRFVEFGIGQITKCNSTHLAVQFGWTGLLIDGSTQMVEQARRFYREHLPEDPERVRCLESWLTPENINQVLGDAGFRGEIDLLSLDIDGNDYWVWKAIDGIRPRVVVAEYNASLGVDEPLITQYDESFSRFAKHPFGWYHGASLPAMERLGRAKGYRLVGCDSMGFNAFFVRSDLALELRTLDAKEAFYPDARRLRVSSQEEQFESLRHLPLEADD